MFAGCPGGDAAAGCSFSLSTSSYPQGLRPDDLRLDDHRRSLIETRQQTMRGIHSHPGRRASRTEYRLRGGVWFSSVRYRASIYYHQKPSLRCPAGAGGLASHARPLPRLGVVTSSRAVDGYFGSALPLAAKRLELRARTLPDGFLAVRAVRCASAATVAPARYIVLPVLLHAEPLRLPSTEGGHV